MCSRTAASSTTADTLHLVLSSMHAVQEFPLPPDQALVLLKAANYLDT